jgi:chemotaxis protein methyltransferase CheR
MLDDDPAFNRLVDKVTKNTGIDCNRYKRTYLRRGINARIRAKNLDSYSEYMRILDHDPEEYGRFLDGFTINVSEFFRDLDTFDSLRNNVIPSLLAYKKDSGRKIIRVWSAGCACGEETCSIAILLQDLMREDLDTFVVSVYGTDVDKESLYKARRGVYEETSVKNVKKILIDKYFDYDGRYRVKDDIKKITRFNYHDLLSGKFASYFDIIFCRNVLIYFSKEQKEILFNIFYDSLNNKGYLILGKTEVLSTETKRKFSVIDNRERVYQKE